MNAGAGIRTWCAASTALRPKELAGGEQRYEDDVRNEEDIVSCISEAKLSPDGTCIFTTDYDRKFSVYAFAPDVSQENQQYLAPYAQFASADPNWAFAVNPYFNLNERETTTVLVSHRDQYIGLHNALWDTSKISEDENQHAPSQKGPVNISSKIVSYKLVNKLTEAVTAPLSLAWSPDGAYFYAGEQNQIAVFDMTYTDDPISTIRTIPSTRNKLKGGGWGFKGGVSALSPCPRTSTTNADVLAAGTRTRFVGLYDAVSSQEITHFALPGTINGKRTDNPNMQDIIGQGVTQLKWSPDGQYLYVAERSSDALLIYDVRNFSLALGHCAGRQALTRQKMGFDVWAQMNEYDTDENHEIWAGGTDGKVRVWRNPYLREGAIEADEVISVGEDPVSNVLVHPYGHAAVVARGRYEVGGDVEARGIKRGGLTEPAYREWGCLDILGLGSY
ncbi:guanyl nucleotide binding protein [Bimuria novae-zelandiae CBS 107.79]|uniref:Guanyl nucleotide binding protein n=1 Tax=Bimuria novae-zelandiae CBS 107.79 TaxID=1447943 RepID=A0A6A5UV92_9PLEO|nr:guanyl nucleotide binding protein [Bimuria novae-zelandiae CBS 107.79]